MTKAKHAQKPDTITRHEMIDIAHISMTKLNLALLQESLNPPKPIKTQSKIKYTYDRKTALLWLAKYPLKTMRFSNLRKKIRQDKAEFPIVSETETGAFNNRLAMKFLATLPTKQPKIPPTKVPIERQTVHINERNEAEIPCKSLMPVWRGERNHSLNIISNNTFAPF